MAASVAIYTVSDKVQATVFQVAANVVSIQSLELRAVMKDIAYLKKEQRELNRELRTDPDDENIIEDIEEVRDEMEALELQRDCLLDPEKEVCG